jgi:hypothetical protein
MPRNFVVVKAQIGSTLDTSFLANYNVTDAVVKVQVETAPDFQYRKELIEGINSWLADRGAYHIHSVVVVSKPTFVSRNATVVETASIDENVAATLDGMAVQNKTALMEAHAALYKVVQEETEED